MREPRWSRLLAAVVLSVTGFFSMPVTALFMDDTRVLENLILPAAVVLNALLGTGLGAALPSIAGVEATRSRGAAVGALAGAVTMVVAAAILFILIAG
jgi:hypothetical protein